MMKLSYYSLELNGQDGIHKNVLLGISSLTLQLELW